MLDWSLEQTNAPVAIRVPVGPVNEMAVTVSTDYSDQKNEVTQAGTQVAIVGVGNFYALAEEIAEQLKMQHGITPTVINPKFISGVDKELLDAVARSHKLVVTLEDGIREGGYGQMIASYLGDREIVVKNYGLEKKFYDNYRAADVLSELGITVETITKDIMEQLQQSIH
jgi:1-deoxy-D-xylulose-5-phosphate synthase